MPTWISLDLGTTTIVGLLFDSERAKVLRLASRPNDSTLVPDLPSRAEQDPQQLRGLALDLLAELASSGLPVDGIALTGQMHGLLCAGAAGQPLSPFISWQDQRTAEPLPGGGTLLDEIHARVAGLPWWENGCRIAHGYGAATLFWLRQHGALPPGTRWVCTLPGWLAANLTGRPPVTDPSLACSWGVYSLVHGAWNPAFLDRLGLERQLFPPVRPSGARLGGLAPGVAQQVGLPAGLPVFNALGDHQASFLASVAEPAQSLMVNVGTGGQIAWLAPGFEAATDRVETRPLPGGGSLRVGASLCGGAAYAWLNRTLRHWLAAFGLVLDEDTAYQQLNALAAAALGTDGLRVRTTFLGVRGDPTVQAGAIEGITLDNLRLGPLARATLLGLIDELHDLYRSHGGQETGHRFLVASGNGVQKNPLLPGLLEERFGLPVQMPHWPEPAAVGAAMVAGS